MIFPVNLSGSMGTYYIFGNEKGIRNLVVILCRAKFKIRSHQQTEANEIKYINIRNLGNFCYLIYGKYTTDQNYVG